MRDLLARYDWVLLLLLIVPAGFAWKAAVGGLPDAVQVVLALPVLGVAGGVALMSLAGVLALVAVLVAVVDHA